MSAQIRRPRRNASASLRIDSTPNGFELWGDDERRCDVDWSDVARIVAFKVDLLTMDAVCLEVQLASGAVCLVDEEATGFWELVTVIKRVLPISQQEWEQTVVPSAFVENRTVIFQRA